MKTKTLTRLWERLDPEPTKLAALTAHGDRRICREELDPIQAATERLLGAKLPDRSPERCN